MRRFGVVQNPVVFVPGITGSALADQYPLSPDTVWSLVQRKYDRVALHPDDRRYERAQPARVVPERVFAVPYGEFIEDLRHDLSAPGKAAPVYPWAYDWRQPLAHTEALLAEFIEEAIDRTRLLRHYGAAWRENPQVDLVGHSMGGLIIAGYLASYGPRGRVGKVITLGAPFGGSFEAVMKIATGLASLGVDRQTASEREAARMTPALYHLLPEYEGALDVAAGLPRTLFDPGLWQPAVEQTLRGYIEQYGLPCADSASRAHAVFGELLSEARTHRARMLGLSLANAGLGSRQWLCIAGVGARTRHQLLIEQRDGAPHFVLESSRREDRFDDADPSARHKTGDGTVPFRGATAPFIPPKEMVCVTPEDFGYWELGDRAIDGSVGLHGMLPKMNLVNRLAASFLTGVPREGIWGRPAPGVARRDWSPPIHLLPAKAPAHA